MKLTIELFSKSVSKWNRYPTYGISFKEIPVAEFKHELNTIGYEPSETEIEIYTEYAKEIEQFCNKATRSEIEENALGHITYYYFDAEQA